MRGGLALLILLAAGLVPAAADVPDAVAPPIRVATFNASLNRAAAGALLRDLSTPDDAQVRAVAEIIQRVRPDILLLQEFDHDAAGASLAAFQANYLGRSQNGQPPIRYEYSFFTASNTGMPSGFDLDADGQIGGGGDALGFGEFPGQYAMVLLSRFPIDGAAGAHFRQVPVARHAGRPVARRCADGGPGRLVFGRGTRGAAAVVQESLGCAGAHRQAHAAPADQPSHAARIRRARGSQRQAQSRRNPFLARLPDCGQ